MAAEVSSSVAFRGPQTTAASCHNTRHASAKQALSEVASWFGHSHKSEGFSSNLEFSMVRDDQSPSLLCSQRKQHTSAAKPKPRRLEHSVSPWASLSLSMPSVRKQKPVSAQKQTSLSRPTAISFQASPAHTLPACSDASPASTPPNKRRCIPWHQAEITLSAQHKKQPMLASLTSSFEAGRNNSKQRTVLSTSRTARQSSDHASCVSRRHQHSPVWCLADAGAATRAVDDEAEDVLLTRAKDISLTVRDRLKRASRRMPNQMRRLVAGAVAGALSKTAIAPIETIRMQVMGGKGGILESIGRTWGRKGVLGFFSGNSADILRVIPSKAIELSAFDAYKKFLSREDDQGHLKRPGPLLTGLAGAAAGMTATLGLYPLETLRTRLAMGDYDNMLHAIRAVAAEEGPMAFYQGISASLIGILPYAAIRLGVYDGLKWSHRKYKQDDHIPALNTALYGAVAGLISATATFPVEVVRRRMMVGTVKGSTWTALTTIARNEGWRSLYKGIGLTWAKQAPQYAVTFLAYDLIKEYLEV